MTLDDAKDLLTETFQFILDQGFDLLDGDGYHPFIEISDPFSNESRYIDA